MTAYNFKARFVDPILSGRKRQTIRAHRKRHARPGEELQLYQSMRTKACRLIGRATCNNNEPIDIRFHAFGGRIYLRHLTLYKRDLDGFAQADGFADWAAFCAFWREEHPDEFEDGRFEGVLIMWGDLTARGV